MLLEISISGVFITVMLVLYYPSVEEVLTIIYGLVQYKCHICPHSLFPISPNIVTLARMRVRGSSLRYIFFIFFYILYFGYLSCQLCVSFVSHIVSCLGFLVLITFVITES